MRGAYTTCLYNYIAFVVYFQDGADDYEDNAFDDPIIPSQDDFKDGSQTDHAINQTVYTEDNMVSQPWKVCLGLGQSSWTVWWELVLCILEVI